jgi:hypothetical protein
MVSSISIQDSSEDPGIELLGRSPPADHESKPIDCFRMFPHFTARELGFVDVHPNEYSIQ